MYLLWRYVQGALSDMFAFCIYVRDHEGERYVRVSKGGHRACSSTAAGFAPGPARMRVNEELVGPPPPPAFPGERNESSCVARGTDASPQKQSVTNYFLFLLWAMRTSSFLRLSVLGASTIVFNLSITHGMIQPNVNNSLASQFFWHKPVGIS